MNSAMSTERRLEEREKELACIYSICLLAARAPAPEEAAEGLARALCAAMQHSVHAECEVSFEPPSGGFPVRARQGDPAPESSGDRASISAPLPNESADDWRGNAVIRYRKPGLSFLPQEKALLESVLVIAASMLRTNRLFSDLSSKNAALREVLSMIEDERRKTIAAYRERLTGELLPLAERAGDGSLSAERRESYAALLARELSRELSAIGSDPAAAPTMSPREREIAVQVRNGRSSKEIAELLGISLATVERHRYNIRKKLRVSDRAVNLVGLLNGTVRLPEPER